MKIGICVASYNNPKGLKKLLKSIHELKVHNSLRKITVYVVINAQEITRQYEKIIINYKSINRNTNFFCQVEPNIGIPFARNRLFLMSVDCDYIAFVDDDEFVDEMWLYNYLVNLDDNDLVLTGPVEGVLHPKSPGWAKKSRFFDSDPHQHLGVVRSFYTNNVLIKRSALIELNLPFCEAMAFTGGTDKMLSTRLSRDGVKFKWVANAKVYEDIPLSRCNFGWIYRRKKRIAYSNLLVKSTFENIKDLNVIHSAFKDLVKIVLYILPSFVSDLFRLKLIKKAGSFVGRFNFLIGNRIEEYSPTIYRNNSRFD